MEKILQISTYFVINIWPIQPMKYNENVFLKELSLKSCHVVKAVLFGILVEKMVYDKMSHKTERKGK